MPTLKDPNRVPDASTIRRWSLGLDRSRLAFSFLRQTLARVTHLLPGGGNHEAWLLPCLTPILRIFGPLRL